MNLDSIWEQFNQLTKHDEQEHVPETNECPSCFQQTVCLDSVNGTMVCTSCGCIVEQDVIDQSAEWNYNSDDVTRKDPSRCGCPINPLLEKSSMSTMIQYSATNGFMRKLHNQMSMNYVERSRYHVFEDITKMSKIQNS